MVDERVTDGKRIGELLSSEITGHENDPYGDMRVGNADPDVEPTAEGERAYDIRLDGEHIAEVYVMPDRARLELRAGLERGEHEAEQQGLRTRPVGSDPPKVVVFVESGAEVKRVLDVLGAVAEPA
jgi:hypothetical protein